MPSLLTTRRTFFAALGATAASGLPAFARKEGVAPPSLLLILADHLPADLFGCYGNSAAKTPNLDALARRGVRFQNALASSRGGPTGRATLLSGRTPFQHGLTGPGQSIDANEVLLTDLLADEGYDVGFVGPWGLTNDQQPGHGIRWPHIVPADSVDAAPSLTRKAVEFLDQQKAGAKPYFLTISHPESSDAAAIDREIPKLIDKLREKGLEDSTTIVFTSAGRPPESLGIPLIYFWPAHTPVQAHPPEMIGSYDFLPTICDAAAAIVPDRNLCGRSYYLPVAGKFFPKKHPWKPMVYGAFGDVDTVTDRRFKLILAEDGKARNGLFDLVADPEQKVNQFGNRSFIAARDELRRNLLDWKTKYSK